VHSPVRVPQLPRRLGLTSLLSPTQPNSPHSFAQGYQPKKGSSSSSPSTGVSKANCAGGWLPWSRLSPFLPAPSSRCPFPRVLLSAPPALWSADPLLFSGTLWSAQQRPSAPFSAQLLPGQSHSCRCFCCHQPRCCRRHCCRQGLPGQPCQHFSLRPAAVLRGSLVSPAPLITGSLVSPASFSVDSSRSLSALLLSPPLLFSSRFLLLYPRLPQQLPAPLLIWHLEGVTH
jgi:hypothetical protein